MINFWSFKNEYNNSKKKIFSSIDRVFRSGNVFFGNELANFEKNFIKTNKSKYGLAVRNGTDALFLTLKAFGVKANDEIITVSNTAIPTVSAILNAGAKVRFADIGEDYLINPECIESQINKKTKAIVVVHLFGQSCEMNKINKIAKKYKLIVIEDCAQSQGAMYKNKFVGNLGDAGCFSFYPTKIIGAYGDGGFITLKSKSVYKKLLRMRFYGIENIDKKNKYFGKYYSHQLGTNSRIDEIQLSILNSKLPNLKKYIKHRNKIAKIYFDKLKKTTLRLPTINNNNNHVFHLFTVYHKKRDEILNKLKKKINLNIYYPYPIHKMKMMKPYLGKNKLSLPVTEKMSKGIFSLPLYPNLKYSEINMIIKSLIKILKTL